MDLASRRLPLLWLILPLLAAVLLWPPASVGQDAEENEGVSLRWRLEPGKTWRIRGGSESVSTSLMGRTLIDMQDRETWRVREVDDEGIATVSITVDVLKMEVGAPGIGRGTLDTEADDDEAAEHPFVRGFDKLAGKSHEARMTSRGEVVKVTGFTEMWKLAVTDNPIFSRLLSVMTDENRRREMEAYAGSFPEEPVSVGATWRHSLENKVEKGCFLRFDLLYTLTSYSEEDGIAVISMEAAPENVELRKEEGIDPDDPMAAAIKQMKLVGGTYKGEFRFDNRIGLPLSNRAEIKAKYTLLGLEMDTITRLSMDRLSVEED